MNLPEEILLATQPTLYERTNKEFSPWSIEKCFNQPIGNKSVSIRLKSDSDFIIEISHESENIIHPKITELNVPQYQQIVEVKFASSYKLNQSKGRIYIDENKQRTSQNASNS